VSAKFTVSDELLSGDRPEGLVHLRKKKKEYRRRKRRRRSG
jgi:hypothetical protein